MKLNFQLRGIKESITKDIDASNTDSTKFEIHSRLDIFSLYYRIQAVKETGAKLSDYVNGANVKSIKNLSFLAL
jgi:hypothetical protein